MHRLVCPLSTCNRAVSPVSTESLRKTGPATSFNTTLAAAPRTSAAEPTRYVRMSGWRVTYLASSSVARIRNMVLLWIPVSRASSVVPQSRSGWDASRSRTLSVRRTVRKMVGRSSLSPASGVSELGKFPARRGTAWASYTLGFKMHHQTTLGPQSETMIPIPEFHTS
jgi:hypothetical protein